MNLFKCCVFAIIQFGLMHGLYAKVKLENLSDYNFGLVRPGYYPIKEASVSVYANFYRLSVYGQHDANSSFNLANGIYTVQYAVSWKDDLGNWVNLLPNTWSPIFQGINTDRAIQTSLLQMQIKGDFPQPGHYSDTLTVLINPV